MTTIPPIRGRGTSRNPASRFVPLQLDEQRDWVDPDDPAPATSFWHDASRSIIVSNDSPDVRFTHSVNPYRGCETGCVYCYARPYHEYLDLSAGLDFETKILVKPDAPKLLRAELAKKSWEPVALAFSGVTDCYQPVERRLLITRGCLEVCAEFRNPVGVVTKNHLVVRDADVLADLAAHGAAAVCVSVTTLDGELARRMEPRATQPPGRLAAIRELSAAGVPVGVLMAPLIPGLNDHEIPAVLEAARDAGATFAGFVVLRLPFGLKELFAAWLEQHYPDRKEKVLGRVRAMRGGQLNSSAFGTRMTGEGVWAKLVHDVFVLQRNRLGLAASGPTLSTASFRRPGVVQRSLFDGM